MRFDTLEFVMVFLPVTLLLFHAVRSRSSQWALAWLAGASLFFYGWWDIRFVPLILGSILVNFWIGRLLLEDLGTGGRQGKTLLAVGVTFNLGLIACFKYADFLVGTGNGLVGLGWTLPGIVLPLAISFFTFQQIAFLADVRGGQIRNFGFLEYGLFVLFFPQLIAGPIVHFRQVVPQFRALLKLRSRPLDRTIHNIAIGLGIFAIGLFKKAVFADGLAAYVDPVYDAAASGATLTIVEAWGATLSFTFQIYFDFSGYSDMAIGLARMFGIRLPLNFDAPYKADNIVEFWHRWHKTLSQFLRDYLYIPLGGNRKGRGRRYFNLMITMLLGGLWHGAAWTFVVWGAAHGLFLVICHGWHRLRRSLGWDGSTGPLGSFFGRLITFLAVSIAWVLFRADGFDTAERILASMFGFNGVTLPDMLKPGFGPLVPHLEAIGLTFGPSPYFSGAGHWVLLGVYLFLVWYCPTTQEIFARFRPAIDFRRAMAGPPFVAAALRGGFLRHAATVLSGLMLLAVSTAFALAAIPPAQSEGRGLAVLLAGMVLVCFAVASLVAQPRLSWRPNAVYLAIWSAMLFVDFMMLYQGGGGEFIYFQF